MGILTLFQVFLLCLLSVNAITQVPEISLDNLITIDSLNDLSKNWIPLDDTIYNEGRIILTPKPNHIAANEQGFQLGSIWSTRNPSINLQSFTIEFTARSVGSYGLTNAGLSLFLVNDNTFDINDKSNYGGPSKFIGLQILLNFDDKLGPSIKIYLNDGQQIDLNNYIGAYKYEYQASSIPMTLKLGYDSNSRTFKITCDNKLLFETNQINLSNLLSKNNVRLGISGESKKSFDKHEQFEILKLISYDSVTNELKETEDETLVALHGDYLTQQKPDMNQFIQRQQKLREQLQNQKSITESSNSNSDTSINNDIIELKNSIDMIMSILEKTDQTVIQQQIFQLSKSIDRVSTNFVKFHENFQNLNNKYNELSDMFKRQFSLLDNYDTTLRSFDRVLQTQLKNTDNLDNKLSKLSSYYSSSESNKLNNNDEYKDSFANIKSLLYIILVPVLVLLGIVALWVYKLRNDIKHAKVL